MASLPDCPHMPRKCIHYDPDQCDDLASRKCHYVQNTINSAVTVRSALVNRLTLLEATEDFSATRAYLEDIEAFLRSMGLNE